MLVPHQQITERGFAAVMDGSPLIAMSVTEQGSIAKAVALEHLPDDPISLTGGGFDTEDGAYADTVRAVLANEIGKAPARTSSSSGHTSPLSPGTLRAPR